MCMLPSVVAAHTVVMERLGVQSLMLNGWFLGGGGGGLSTSGSLAGGAGWSTLGGGEARDWTRAGAAWGCMRQNGVEPEPEVEPSQGYLHSIVLVVRLYRT